ncbi:ethanolamine utilization protein EutH [Zhongshania borealis]|uniref:Ethanolamine utilization protein EutH n=1 Tax=Zhongshania borealis TaxID=889488 RepID=A0ABP7W6F6_9GAMM
MEMLNQIILYIMMSFMVIGALDRIFQQFGGSEPILGKIGMGKLGKSIGGSGNQFEEGFNAMGALALAMVGIIAIAPVLAKVLSPIVVPIYTALGADPAMFATTLLANDMGGYFLAKELATGADGVINYSSWMYAGLILGAMMGPTIVFSIPVAVGIIDVKDRPYLAAGIMAGIVTIPLGCIAGGFAAMASTVMVPGSEQLIEFNLPLIFMNLIPVIIVSALIAAGLWLIPDRMINGFSIFAKFLVAFITLGLMSAVLERTLGITIIPGMDPIFMTAGDSPGVDMRAVEVIGSIAIILLGAYPMVLLLTRWFEKPLLKMGGVLNVNPTAATGLIATLANNIPMFQVMKDMDSRGKILCSAFAVSAAFTFGDHLGFTAANKPDMIMAVIIGKLVGGITAVLFAMLLADKMIASIEKNSPASPAAPNPNSNPEVASES